MPVGFTHEFVRDVRNDTVRLAHLSFAVLDSALRISKAFAGTSSLDGFAGMKQARWRVALLLFAELLHDLRAHLEAATKPSGELVEWLDAGGPAAVVMGIAGASRVVLARELAAAVTYSVHGPSWPAGSDAVSLPVTMRPQDLTAADVSQIVKMATDIAGLGTFQPTTPELLVAEINAETAGVMRRLGPIAPPPALSNTPAPNSPPVILYEKYRRAVVMGKKVQVKTAPRCKVLRALLDAYEQGKSFTKDELTKTAVVVTRLTSSRRCGSPTRRGSP